MFLLQICLRLSEHNTRPIVFDCGPRHILDRFNGSICQTGHSAQPPYLEDIEADLTVPFAHVGVVARGLKLDVRRSEGVVVGEIEQQLVRQPFVNLRLAWSKGENQER